MLLAIGIYIFQNDSRVFEKNKFAQQDTGLFNSSALDDFEKNILPTISFPVPTKRICCIEKGNEFTYIKNLNDSQGFILILSRKALEYIELSYLFLNIRAVYEQPQLNTTLHDILINPLGYMNKEIVLVEMTQELEKIKKIALDDIDQVILRGNKLDDLLEKTEKLTATSLTFVHHTKKLNRSCC